MGALGLMTFSSPLEATHWYGSSIISRHLRQVVLSDAGQVLGGCKSGYRGTGFDSILARQCIPGILATQAHWLFHM